MDEEKNPREVEEAYEPRYTDKLWVGIAVIVIIGFVVLSAIDLSDYNKTKCFKRLFSSSTKLLAEPTVLLVLLAAIVAALVLSALYYSLATVLTKKFIVATMVLQVVVSLGSAIFYLVRDRWLTGTFNLVWLIFSIAMYWALYNNIDCATTYLQAVMEVAESYPSIILVSVLASIFCAAWSVLIASVMMAGFGKVTTSECTIHHKSRPESEFFGLLVYLSFTNAMMIEIVKSVIRATTCSVYGYWYYQPAGSPASKSYMGTLGGLRLALTYSFGSLCFASIWVSVIGVGSQLLAGYSQLLVTDQRYRTLDVSVVIIVWFFSHCVTVIDQLCSHFSNYVLVNIALYNTSYIEGAQRAFNMIRNDGCQALVNDCLASGALTFGTWSIGTLCGLVSYVYMWQFTDYPSEGIHFISAYAMIIGSQIAGIFITSISSGVQTLFVALSHDPEMVHDTQPELAKKLEIVRKEKLKRSLQRNL